MKSENFQLTLITEGTPQDVFQTILKLGIGGQDIIMNNLQAKQSV